MKFTYQGSEKSKYGYFTGDVLSAGSYKAFYPYGETPPIDFPKNAFQLTGQKQIGESNEHLSKWDLLYSNNVTVKEGDKTANFFFNHALSLHELKINLKEGSSLQNVQITKVTFAAHKTDAEQTPVNAFAVGIYYDLGLEIFMTSAQDSKSSIEVTEATPLTSDKTFSVFTVLSNVRVSADQYPYQIDLQIDYTHSGGTGTFTQSNIKTVDAAWSEYKAGTKYTNNKTPIEIDIRKYFPDANFRAALVQDYGLTESNGDIDPNSESNKAIISGLTEIVVYKKSISSLKGVEYFTALTSLSCNANQLTSLDLSSNTELTTLYCNINQLTSLDVSANKKLIQIQCLQNRLTSVNVSGCAALTSLNCTSNQLTSLDVSSNMELSELYCYTNQLTSLDLSSNMELTRLQCYNNNMDQLDIRKLGKLSKDSSLMLCGNQKDNKTLTLTLTSAQKTEGWDPYWSKNSNNVRVTPVVSE